jgi:hypothetical protein
VKFFYNHPAKPRKEVDKNGSSQAKPSQAKQINERKNKRKKERKEKGERRKEKEV